MNLNNSQIVQAHSRKVNSSPPQSIHDYFSNIVVLYDKLSPNSMVIVQVLEGCVRQQDPLFLSNFLVRHLLIQQQTAFYFLPQIQCTILSMSQNSFEISYNKLKNYLSIA